MVFVCLFALPTKKKRIIQNKPKRKDETVARSCVKQCILSGTGWSVKGVMDCHASCQCNAWGC